MPISVVANILQGALCSSCARAAQTSDAKDAAGGLRPTLYVLLIVECIDIALKACTPQCYLHARSTQ
jgi:hypothetical protein